MGECMSICDRKERDIEEPNKNDNAEDSDDKDDINYSLPENMQRTKKNKTRIPRNVIVDEDEELLPTINLNENKKEEIGNKDEKMKKKKKK